MEQIKTTTKLYKLAMKHKFSFGVFLCAVITVFYCLISIWVLNDETYVVDIIPQENIKDGAEFAAGLMSALALAFVVFSIFIQHEELILQRYELENTRKELEGQKEEVKKQNKILKIQQFESTFFQLLKVYTDKINKIESEIGTQKYASTTEMMINFKSVSGYLNIKKSEYPNYDKRAFLKDFQNRSFFYREEFKSLYSLLYYVSVTNFLSELDKKTYINILTNQLSLIEKAWLFFFAFDNNSLKPLIEKYGIFREIKEEINDGDDQYVFMFSYLDLYKQTAYEFN